jgi:branched-chain amino acid transport system ATP-binding protein
MTALFETRGLCSGYGAKRVLEDVDVSIEPGEIVALLGPNGAGKTTFIASAVNATRRFAGSVHFDGREVSDLPTWRFASEGVAVVPQGIGVFPDLTVAENLRLGRDAAGRDPKGETEEELLWLFPILREKWRQPTANLSGGQRQMVAIARALSARPRLLLLDEPSLGLAPQAVSSVMEQIRAARDRLGLSVVLAEQDVTAASTVCSRFYLLRVGRVDASGEVGDDFRERLAAEYMA